MRPFNESFRYTRLSSPEEDSSRFDHGLYGSICANYMIYLFASAKYLYPSPLSAWQEHLPKFITSVLRHSGLDLPVLIVAMTYLCKYKEANIFSVAYDDDAYRLFFASYTIAAQVSSGLNDDRRRHHIAPWSRIASGGGWDDEELLIMQATFRSALKGDVRVDPDLYVIFQKIFKMSVRTSSPHSMSSQYLQPRTSSSSKSNAPVTPPPLYEETLARPKVLCASPISPARTASELEEEDHQIWRVYSSHLRLPTQIARFVVHPSNRDLYVLCGIWTPDLPVEIRKQRPYNTLLLLYLCIMHQYQHYALSYALQKFVSAKL